jgi:hypothetical protein
MSFCIKQCAMSFVRLRLAFSAAIALTALSACSNQTAADSFAQSSFAQNQPAQNKPALSKPQRTKVSTLDQLEAECTDTMIKDACKLMKNGPELSTVAHAESVMIAGLGRIDGALYRSLRASGQAMCQTIRATCSTDWESTACKAARAIYSPTLAK